MNFSILLASSVLLTPLSPFQEFLTSRHLSVPGSNITLGIGSCHDSIRQIKNTGNLAQSNASISGIFHSIKDVYRPDLFIWLGDAVYLDRGDKWWSWWRMRWINTEKS